MNERYAYLLVSINPDKSLQLVSICTNFARANQLLQDQEYLIIKLEMNKGYLDGLGMCEHWYYN